MSDVRYVSAADFANRPAADPLRVGRLFYSIDTKVLYRDTGTSWVAVVETDDVRGYLRTLGSGIQQYPVPGNHSHALQEETLRGMLYEAVLNILGSGGIIVPLADPKHGVLSGATLKTVGDEQVTFTSDPAGHNWNDWDTVPGVKGIIPVMDFNGIDEGMDTPDDAAWDGGDGSVDNPISVGVWVYPRNVSSEQRFIDKFLPYTQGDYRFQLTSTGKLQFLVLDASVSKNPTLTADAAVTINEWVHVVATYDGTGGTNCLQDPNCVLYIDGQKVAATFSADGGGYVAMEGGTNDLDIGNSNGANWFDGQMAGGPLGPFFVKRELSADEVLRLYEFGRDALEL